MWSGGYGGRDDWVDAPLRLFLGENAVIAIKPYEEEHVIYHSRM